MIASFQLDNYVGKNRGADSTKSVEATLNQKAPEFVGNFSLTKILSPKTFFDLKAAYFTGYSNRDPKVGSAPYYHYENSTGITTGSAGYFNHADRERFQANASITHYVDKFITGSHDFKFGAEFERSAVRTNYGYTGEGGPLGDHISYSDYYGEPYLAYQYSGYDLNTRYTRLEAFVQDAWQINKRLNINVGLRLSQNWGQVKGVSGNVYTSTRLAPRIGFTFDLLGDKTTILKGHYGQFTEAMLASYHDRMNPDSAFGDFVEYSYDYGAGAWVEDYRIVHTSLYTMDPDIKHPYMDQFTVSLERELFKDTSLSVTYINRKWNHIIGPVDLTPITRGSISPWTATATIPSTRVPRKPSKIRTT